MGVRRVREDWRLSPASRSGRLGLSDPFPTRTRLCNTRSASIGPSRVVA